MYQNCVDNQTPPNMKPGDTTPSGKFFRNLRKEDVAKRYEDDDNEQPEYGFKLKKRYWKYVLQHPLFSTNLCSCIHTEECSIVLQPDNNRFFHVALIDLGVLNQSPLLTSQFLAQYKPVEESQNRCHFEISPTEGTALKWMQVGALLDDPFPEKQLPITPEEKARAKQEYQRYCSYFDIRGWVRKKDGTLE